MRDAVSTLAIRARELREGEEARGRMRLAVAIVLIAFLMVFGVLVALLICAHAGTWPTSSSVSPSKPRRDGLAAVSTLLTVGVPTPTGLRSHTPPLGGTLEEA